RRELRGRMLAGSIATYGANAIDAHETCNTMLAARFPRFSKIQENSRCSVDAMTCNVRCPDQSKQSCVFLISIRYRLLHPSVVATAADAKNATHLFHAVLMLVRFDEFVMTADSSWTQ